MDYLLLNMKEACGQFLKDKSEVSFIICQAGGFVALL